MMTYFNQSPPFHILLSSPQEEDLSLQKTIKLHKILFVITIFTPLQLLFASDEG